MGLYEKKNGKWVKTVGGGGTGGGASGDAVTDAVRYSPQELTDEQKLQAQKNIGRDLVVFNTAENKPSDVLEAINAGRPYAVQHADKTFGLLVFENFGLNMSLNVVFSSGVLWLNGAWGAMVLGGYLDNDTWDMKVSRVAEYTDLPGEPLIGSTSTVTPGQVYKALMAGRAVSISHTDAIYGSMTFGYTSHAALIGNQVVSSIIFEYAEMVFAAQLFGQIGDKTWSFRTTLLAKADDIPEIPSALKNPYALTINGTAYDGSKEVNLSIMGGSGGSGDNIPDYVRTEAERVAQVVQSRQNANTITFIACSDIHYSSPDNANPIASAQNQYEAVTHMGQAMGLIREKVHIDFAAMLGDMIWDTTETADEALAEVRFVNEQLSNGFGSLPQFRSRGNHENGYDSGANFTNDQVYANIGAFNRDNVGDSKNRVGGYCYRDFDAVKLRVICLNSSEAGGCQFSTQQVSWLTNALDLSEKGDDWCSIILSHHPLDWGKSGGVDPTATINSAYGVIGAFHGHIHNFKVDTIKNTTIKRIAIPNVCYGLVNTYDTAYDIDWSEDTSYPKTEGTAEDTSFCVVSIDLAAQKIYADHYGAGYSREIDYTYKSAGARYTNLVETSTDPATGEVYGDDNNGDGKPDGYRNGKYASGANEGTDAACVLTGLIAYGTGVTTPIYIKGANVDTTQSHCRIIAFNAAKEAAFQSAAGSAISTYFTVETLGDSYYRLTPAAKWISDVAYCNYLRFSLIGTGANLVITVGEPIA